MSAKGAWSDSYLHTSEADYPAVVWGYTDDKPVFGEGAALYFKKESPDNTSKYWIYQSVNLKSGDA